MPATAAGGRLPAAGTFLAIEQGGVVLSACRRSDDAERVQLRVYNPDSTPTLVAVGLQQPLRAASRVDFLERPKEELEIRDGAAMLTVGGHEIATVVFTPES